MSEFEPIQGLRSFSPECAAGIAEFDDSRIELYGWLIDRAAELSNFEETRPEADERINQVSASFEVGTAAIRNIVADPNSATDLIMQVWVHDEKERVKLFNDLMPQIRFELMDVKMMQTIIRQIIRMPNEEVVARNIARQYHGNLIADAVSLLAHADGMRELMQEYGKEVHPLPETELGKQFIVNLDYLRSHSGMYGSVVLRGMKDQLLPDGFANQLRGE